MSAVESAPAPAPGSNRPRHRRGPRRGGNRGGATANTPISETSLAADPALAAQIGSLVLETSPISANIRGSNGGRGGHSRRGGAPSASTAPSRPTQPAAALSQPTSVPEASSTSTRGSHGSRGHNGRRGGPARGGRRGGAQMMVNGQRAFGGQLTEVVPGATSSEPSLAGDAPEFVPGGPFNQRARPPPQVRQAPRPRRMSKSQAPDIATRTHEDIANGQYECGICTNEVMSNSKIWTCKTCWSVLHLSCVKRWSKNEVSTHQQRATENGEIPPPRQWRCPGCNLPKQELPNNYTCWCEKEVDPRSIAGLPPHSCGQTCSKPRVGRCPHPCELICHAGPCPPCGHMGPSQSCFCGKEATSRRCIDTNYEGGWSCGQICDDVLPCGEHNCKRGCHEGLCGSCEVMMDSRCYCGKVEKSLPCSERDDEKESHLEDESWMGTFDCGAECKRPYDCGNPDHFCEKGCHTQDVNPAHCPFSPDVVTHCPCGKTSIDSLVSEPRGACSAPIPRCKQKCENLLSCGHLCQQTCHEGECRPCLQTIQIACRCGRTTSNTMCHQGIEEPPSCIRVCRSTLNCGRHECGERCCPGEKKASERQASKRKHRALNSAPRPVDENFEAEHICLKACGRPLKCGNHLCAELCHKGPCHSCLEAIFNEISCACGRTVLQPPQPCGTSPPDCHFDCTRERNCGHPQIKHQCHEDTEPCPKCPFLVEKPCVCGKKTLKNQPCWHTEVRCGIPCGKKLKCGIHTCQKDCHRAGQCEDAATPCRQSCGRQKTVCEHSCSDSCHAPYPCKEATPCQSKMFITCECQNRREEVRCLATKSSSGNTSKVLDCNTKCLEEQRKAQLKAALLVDPASHVDDHIPYASKTLSFYNSYPSFAQQYEREFRVFAQDANQKHLRFKPMQAHQRGFIHSLAEDFGLVSESLDPEPHRHVSLFKGPHFVSAPFKTIGQCVKIKAQPAPVSESSSSKLVSNAEPYNSFLLTDPKFGLVIDELRVDLAPELSTTGLEFDIQFLPSGNVVLKALASSSSSWLQKTEPTLLALKPSISKKISLLKLAGATSLCTVDGSLNITRREDDSNAASGGWSQVAKGGSGVKRVQEATVGKKSSFTVLGTKVKKDKEKKELLEDAPDDWEKEVEAWGDS